jgi:hypothetical protein
MTSPYLPTPFSYVQLMFRLEKIGLSPLYRNLGEDDEAYLLRTQEKYPGVVDDMVAQPKRRAA